VEGCLLLQIPMQQHIVIGSASLVEFLFSFVNDVELRGFSPVHQGGRRWNGIWRIRLNRE
jgi:hypothetical protein